MAQHTTVIIGIHDVHTTIVMNQFGMYYNYFRILVQLQDHPCAKSIIFTIKELGLP